MKKTKKSAVGAVTPQEALAKLKEGNARFEKGLSALAPKTNRSIRKQFSKQQSPFAIILSCSDSRAPSEILFDQGLGDLFVIRVAGNIVAPSLVGSVEYAAAMTSARLVVVMGHTQCGAIKATYDAIKGQGRDISDNVRNIVERIQPHIQPIVSKASKTNSVKVLNDSMRANVLASANHLRSASRILEDMISRNELAVVGAAYNIATGKVQFFDVPDWLK